MMQIAMSDAASGLLRALLARARVPRNRILLSDVRSIDWRSLTFGGERHLIRMRIAGRDSARAVARMCDGLEDAEFSIPGMIVADIAIAGVPRRAFDGSTEIMIEALTIGED